MSKTYLLINTANNIIENAVVWDGNTETWQPPSGFIALDSETTPSINWQWDENANDWIQINSIGTGEIGYCWDGKILTIPKPLSPLTIKNIYPITEGGPSVIAE